MPKPWIIGHMMCKDEPRTRNHIEHTHASVFPIRGSAFTPGHARGVLAVDPYDAPMRGCKAPPTAHHIT